MIVLFINCKLFPFISWIIAGIKIYETRNRNTLKSIIGKQVFLAETGKHKKPLIKCIATINEPIKIDNLKDYNRYRKQTMIEKNSVYDFTRETKYKYLYRLSNVQKVKEFYLPGNAVYHGRIFATIDNTESR